MSETRDFPVRIYAGHLGGGRRIWKSELSDEAEKAFSCEYVRADLASAAPDMAEALVEIDALDPEGQISGVSHDACKGLIARMGQIARAAIAKARDRS